MIERSLITDDGVRLVFGEIGPRDGVPVVLCHGLTMDGGQYSGTAEAFAARGCRVLVPDLRGHGRSSIPSPVSRETFSLARLAADQVALLDAAGLERVHWVGNSLGGIVGLQLLGSGRLASLCTYGTAYTIGLHGHITEPWVKLSFRVLPRSLLARGLAMLVSRRRAAQDIVATHIRETPPAVISAIAGVVGRYDLRSAVRNAGIPVLLLDCRGDWLVGWAMGSTLRLARRLEGVTVLPVNGGHCADLDAPEAFRELVAGFVGAPG